MYNVLVLDDEKNIRLTIKRCLETPEITVEDAINGEEALKLLKETAFDLLLLDLKLPGMDGMEILQLVKNQYPAMKVVIITAHGTIQTAVEAMKTGALDFVEKPFTPADLRTVVHNALSK
jgi:DNA-binding NtrC family response regulator